MDGIQPIIDVSHFYGIWPSKDTSIFYKMYMVILLLTFGAFNFITIIIPIFLITDVTSSTDIIYMCLTAVAEIPKLFLWLFNFNKIINLIEVMKRDLILDSDDEVEKELISKEIIKIRRLFKFIRTCFSLTALFSSIYPIFLPERRLPVTVVYPFDWNNDIITFVCTYVFQSCAVFVCIQWNSVMDTMPSCVLCILGGYYEALGYNFQKIGWTYKRINSTNDDRDALKVEFRKLVDKYSKILKFV